MPMAAATADFIELQALGKAIAATHPSGIDASRLPTDLGKEPHSSVVLIDEIDKAPRDFPNDILSEIEQYEFQIKELDNYTIRKRGYPARGGHYDEQFGEKPAGCFFAAMCFLPYPFS
ncbi:MAG: hypothetical protein R2795_08695 [Saprospiraceae bacterium]